MPSSGGRYQPLLSEDIDLQKFQGGDDYDNLSLSDDDRDDKQRIVHCYPSKSSRSFACFPKCRVVVSFIILAILIIIATGGVGVYYTAIIIDGQSPPWYPSPRGGTLPSWQESYKKAQILVDRMTLTEKVNVTTGTGWGMDLCVGSTGTTSVGFPSLCMQDGPLGIRFVDHSTSFPAGITVGSTWNRVLMRKRGEAHGREAKLKGINSLLSPVVGALGRNPAGGRNWEGFGADPVLQAVAGYETIMGIQSQGVMATVKHFVGNEQEHFRKPFEWAVPESLSSNIDDRTLHELYAWPFAESIRAGVVSVMCSYQMINNSYGCQNSKLLNGILKDEMGFQGFVISDWLAQRSGVASVLAGLDMTMPGDGVHWTDGKTLYGDQLTIAVLNGTVPMQRLNDMVIRIVAAWYQLGQDTWDDEGPNFSSWTDNEIGKWHDGASNSYDTGVVNKFVDVSSDESKQIAREVAAEGTVLLKNDGILPLEPELSALAVDGKVHVMIVGEDAGPGQGPNVCADRGCNQGTLGVGWGSGATDFTYLITPLSALNSTFDESKVEVSASLSNTVDNIVIERLQKQDLCLVFANADAGEGYIAWEGIRADRPNLELQKDGSHLIKTVADHCRGPVIVVIHSVGPVILEEFVDLPKVKAIVFANLPGQESGNALADVLFGSSDASGRLAFTIGKSLEDYGEGAKILYYPNHIIPQIDFNEGLYIDYRHFDKHGIVPRYEFGHGLSYTKFEVTDLGIVELRPKSKFPDQRLPGISPPDMDETIPDVEIALFPHPFLKLKGYIYPFISSANQIKKGQYPYPDGYHTEQPLSAAGGDQGGNPSLFDVHVQVSVRVHNIGTRTGKEVVQLYISFPAPMIENGAIIDMPPRVLRDFQKLELESDQSDIVTMNLTRKDLSYWSVVQQNWIMPVDGAFTIAVGRSSRKIDLTGQY